MIQNMFPKLSEHPMKKLLRDNGITQAQFAALLGVSLGTASHLLNGYRKPTKEQAKKLEALQQKIIISRRV